MRTASGFTLVETMVTVILLAILAAVAAPRFQFLIHNTQMSMSVNSLMYALQSARGEAIKTADRATVCSLSGSTAWLSGWRVLTGADCTLDAGEREILKRGRVEGLEGVSAGASSVSFQRNGGAASATTFTFCDYRGAAQAKAVEVTATGRVRTVSMHADGSALSCP